MQAVSPVYQMQVEKRQLVFYAFLLLFSVFMFASSVSEELKYLKYALPLLLGAVLLAIRKKITLKKNVWKHNLRFRYLAGLTCFYLIACCFNLFKGFYNVRFYQEFYFVLSPLLFSVLLLTLRPEKDYSRAVYFLFWGITAAYIAEKFPFFIEELLHPSLLIDAFLTSELPTESNFAFEFGLFLIVFLEKKEKKYALFAFLLLLLSFKRIAIAAVIIYVLLALVHRLSKGRINPAGNKTLWLLVNCAVVSVLFLFFSGAFDEFIENSFGLSSNFISQGRYNIYQDIFHHFGRIDFFGFGLGSINIFLSNTGYELVNLHSDVLKVFFELGPLFFVLWIFFFYRWTVTFLNACLAIYINVLFFTDNVFIYFDVMFVFYVLMVYALPHSVKEQQLQTPETLSTLTAENEKPTNE